MREVIVNMRVNSRDPKTNEVTATSTHLMKFVRLPNGEWEMPYNDMTSFEDFSPKTLKKWVERIANY